MPDKVDFPQKNFVPEIVKMDQKMTKGRVLWIYWKIWSSIFTEFVL